MLNGHSWEEWLRSDHQIPFDPYAQKLEDWDFLREKVPGLIVASAGGFGLFQASGLLEGYPFYYREEYGHAELRVGALDSTDHITSTNALYASSTTLPDDSNTHFVEIFPELVRRLARAPFLWEFEGLEWRFSDERNPTFQHMELIPDSRAIYYGWGLTPEEGYLAASEPNPSLEASGYSAELQQERFWLAQVSPIPVNKDNRPFPEIDPVFRVNY